MYKYIYGENKEKNEQFYRDHRLRNCVSFHTCFTNWFFSSFGAFPPSSILFWFRFWGDLWLPFRWFRNKQTNQNLPSWNTNRRTFGRWKRMSTGSSRVRLFVPPGGGRGTKCARTRIRLHTPVDQKGSSWVDGLNRGVWNSRFPSKQRSEIVPPAIGNGLAEENKLTNNSRTGIEPTRRSRAQKNNTFLSLFISPVRETYNK